MKKGLVNVITMGCSKNLVDSEALIDKFQKAGYLCKHDPKRIDGEIVVINTCGFIEDAKQESIDSILEMAEYKKTGACRLLVATGCLVQRYSGALAEQMPEIDLLMGVSDYPHICDLLDRALHGARPVACSVSREVFEAPRVLTTAPFSAFVRTGDGCDNRCAYCAIPLIRGGYRSRETEDVLDEIRTLAEKGVKEHVLVAQDTSRFGIDRVGHSQLPELMERAAEIPGVEWLRVLYCYPDEIDEELLNAMARHDNICKYLDLPLQHADPLLLKRMNRRGDPEKTRQLLHRAREMGFTLRTTFIVGFPGETDEQFARLMDFVREIQFDRLGAFTYSPEEDTPAARMDGQIPEEIKQKRLDELMTAQQAISLERNRLRIGTEEKVLVETVDGKGHGVGRSAQEAPDTDGVIKLTGVSEADLGQFVRARITDAEVYDLRAERIRED